MQNVRLAWIPPKIMTKSFTEKWDYSIKMTVYYVRLLLDSISIVQVDQQEIPFRIYRNIYQICIYLMMNHTLHAM